MTNTNHLLLYVSAIATAVGVVGTIVMRIITKRDEQLTQEILESFEIRERVSQSQYLGDIYPSMRMMEKK